MRTNKFISLILISLVLISTMLTGCWDMVEMEDEAFIVGVGIDRGKEKPYKIFFQIEYPSMIREKDSGGDGGKKQPYQILSTEISNIYEGVKKIQSMVDKVVGFEHLQIIIIGKDVAKESLSPLIDYFSREVEVRSRLKMYISKTSAEDIFKVKIPTSPVISLYITDISRNNDRRAGDILLKTDFSSVYRNIVQKNDYVISSIEKIEKSISISGGAVFKGNKLIGYLSSDDMKIYKWFIKEITYPLIIVKNPMGDGKNVLLEIRRSEDIIRPKLVKNQPIIEINMDLQCEVMEVENLEADVSMKENNDKIQSTAQKQIAQEMNALFNKVKKKYKADIFGFQRKFRNYLFPFWSTHKDNWENVFEKIKLQTNVKVTIARIGLKSKGRIH